MMETVTEARIDQRDAPAGRLTGRLRARPLAMVLNPVARAVCIEGLMLLWCSVALGGPVEDMLDSVSEGAQVVGIGESAHGLESFAQTRADATRYLIENHGFRVVAVETRYLLARWTGEWLDGEDEEWRGPIR